MPPNPPLPPTTLESKAQRAAIMAGIREGYPRSGPQSVHLDVTNGCNARCVTCWDHSPLLHTPRTAAWKRNRVNFDTFQAVVEQLAAMGSVRHCVISGMGEPLTHPDIYRILALVQAQGWSVTLISNLVAADPEALAAAKVDQILAGVQGVRPPSYAAFHPGWSETEFFHLCKVLRRLQGGSTRVRHVQVINRDTAPELVEMVRFARTYGADRLNYKLAALGGGTEACAITNEQRDWMLREAIPAARAEAERLGVDTNLSLFEDQLLPGGRATVPLKETGCFMGHVFCRIGVDQEVYYCCNTEVHVGSIQDTPFRDLWWGPKWQALRVRMAQGNYLPACEKCGKFEQNRKWGQRIVEAFGAAERDRLIGRGAP
jgi:MoaA/NifB/PqqE/SkfB family radical SAM enzyme